MTTENYNGPVIPTDYYLLFPADIEMRIKNEILEVETVLDQIIKNKPCLQTAKNMCMRLSILYEVEYYFQERYCYDPDVHEQIMNLYEEAPIGSNVIECFLNEWEDSGGEHGERGDNL